MPTAEARVETERAKRHLDQICAHVGQMARHPRFRRSDHGSDGSTGPPRVLGVESSDRDGVLTFTDGRCPLHADPDALTLRIEAPDEQRLRRLQTMLAKRVETIGRRDLLSVAWHRSDVAPDDTTRTESRKGSRRMAALAILLVKLVVIILVITLPVGLTALASVHGTIMVGLLVVVAVVLVVHRLRSGTLHDVDLHGLVQLHGLVRTVPRTVARIVKARTSR